MTSRTNSRGMSAHSVVNSLLTHPAVEFLPDPGMLIRVYDLSFGIRGLSIMHFQPVQDTVKEKLMAAINTRNLSSTTPPPKAHAPTLIQHVVDAVKSFHTYTITFCDTTTVTLSTKLLTFVNTLRRSYEWDAEDLEELVR
jgi:hypothetical protein